ncbi:hypothetical protein BV20DRAFT_818402 [Pilatotrama ljubarskyi]|nr:hypothetical protein BV20DRAFT_818402 [Pilatotrama ljubarskyi]
MEGVSCTCVASQVTVNFIVLLQRCQNKDGLMYALPLSRASDAAASGLAVGTHQASCPLDRAGSCRNIYFSQNALDRMRPHIALGKELFIRQGLSRTLAPSAGLSEIHMPPVLFTVIEPWCFDSVRTRNYTFSRVRHWASSACIVNIPIEVLMTTSLVFDSSRLGPSHPWANEDPWGERLLIAVQVTNAPAWARRRRPAHAEVCVRHFCEGWKRPVPPAALRPAKAYSSEFTPRVDGVERTSSGPLPLSGFKVGFDFLYAPQGPDEPYGLDEAVRTLTIVARPMYYEPRHLPRLPYVAAGALPPARYAALALTVELSVPRPRWRRSVK